MTIGTVCTFREVAELPLGQYWPRRQTYEWDKLHNEDMRMYDRFCWYRDSIYTADDNVMVVDITKRRSYRATADHFGCSVHNIEKIGKRYRWQERCEAYDAYIALKARQENDKNIRQMLNNHALLGAIMIQKAIQRFQSLKQEELSAADTTKIADTGVKIERMSRGISGEEAVVQITTPREDEKKPAADVDVMPVLDLSKLSDEDLSALEDILGKLSQTDSQ